MSDYLEIEERIRLAIKIGESHYREFKSAFSGRSGDKAPRAVKSVMRDIARTLVAFANADGGELLIGVEDNGDVSGVPHDAGDLDALMSAYVTHVHPDTPLPKPIVADPVIGGRRVVYFSIPKGQDYVYLTAEGRCVKRIDRESVPVSAEQISNDRLEKESRAWDRSAEPRITIGDLNLDLIESVSGQIAYGVSVEKCLQYLDLAEYTPEGLRLNKAAAVLFAKDVRKWHAGCFVRIFTVRGNEKLSGDDYNVVKDDLVAGNIMQLVDEAWNRLVNALSTHTHLTETARFERSLMYPQIACREALINAIVHRNYAIEGRGIEITVYNDRMEILSPGMLLSTITIEDLAAQKGVHESRNPLIARILREVGLVREIGEGMRRIFNVMRSNALAEPDLANDRAGFAVTLFQKSVYDPKVKLWLSNFDDKSLTESQRAVMALGYEGREFSTQDIIDRLGIVDLDQVREIVTPLRAQGLVVRTKSHNKAYQISKKNKIPKREVPTFQVHEGNSASEDSNEPELEIKHVYELFIGNLDYSLSKSDLTGWLSEFCDVVHIDLPSGERYHSVNKGFCFAEIEFQGNIDSLISTLDQEELRGRKVSVRKKRVIRRSVK